MQTEWTRSAWLTDLVKYGQDTNAPYSKRNCKSDFKKSSYPRPTPQLVQWKCSSAVLNRQSQSLLQHHSQHRIMTARTMFIQTQDTPNPNSLKFMPGVDVLGNSTMDFPTSRSAHGSPLARNLFRVDGVQGVFFGPNFITVTKTDDDTVEWQVLKENLCCYYGLLCEWSSYSNRGETARRYGRCTLCEHKGNKDCNIGRGNGFEDGIVKLKMQGACTSCPSSIVTLKNGVQNMMQFYIPEVLGVEQIEDEADSLQQEEFEKVEASINAEPDK
ncbi:putative NFU1 iron-sulfur cluster scaffold-like, mitochondrial [Apostichopus japonicus]|uniref:NFU1 iron-sulfur cluster scaffold homolog, mitochondrial n=1 Tax=Stichopus japonicus TaxID=307972 RepID=A0A2G8LNN5_STIJA|nr:putative NFU1 iron-sulfur cluster scaffold-like, mitochondrial [Apostichopus japonicus]